MSRLNIVARQAIDNVATQLHKPHACTRVEVVDLQIKVSLR